MASFGPTANFLFVILTVFVCGFLADARPGHAAVDFEACKTLLAPDQLKKIEAHPPSKTTHSLEQLLISKDDFLKKSGRWPDNYYKFVARMHYLLDDLIGPPKTTSDKKDGTSFQFYLSPSEIVEAALALYPDQAHGREILEQQLTRVPYLGRLLERMSGFAEYEKISFAELLAAVKSRATQIEFNHRISNLPPWFRVFGLKHYVAPQPLTEETVRSDASMGYFFSKDQVKIPSLARAADSIYKIQLKSTGETVATAFLISERGHLLTADHVLESFKDLNDLQIVQGERVVHDLKIEVLYRDPQTDCGLFQVPNLAGRPHLKLASKDSIDLKSHAGDYETERVFVVGFPAFFSHLNSPRYSVAIVRLNRSYAHGNTLAVGFTQGGNSGGPVLNLSGEVVGVLSSGAPGSDSPDAVETMQRTTNINYVSRQTIESVLKRFVCVSSNCL